MLLSIVIPIYNVEKYIDGTLDSIYSQISGHTSDVEVIMINDGSPDNSRIIAERYYNMYSSCSILIDQDNMGLSCARNAGLKAAKGEYIWFIDSDDSIAPGSISEVIRYIKEYRAEILAFDMIRVNEETGKTKIHHIFFRKYNRNLYNKILDKYHIISRIRETPVQKFIFNREFLGKHRLTFYPGILHEDNEFMARCLFHAERFVPIHYAPYRYLIRSSGSITAVKNPKRIEDFLKITQLIKVYREQHATLYRDKLFLDYYRFLTLHRVLKSKLFKEFRNVITYDKKESRKIILDGIRASLYYHLWSSFFKCIIDLFKNK